ncbi:MAG: hypothetical protein RLZ98_420 [Pseudomonadota bacterium]|jgi:NAD(P)-dependent dehydrogenase (short-subunit alcohol dehydrogenase family)
MKLGASMSAVVTGGASGLGAATARTLAARGVKVAILDLDTEHGEPLAAELGGAFARCDVTEPESVEEALDSVRRVNGIERIAVTCAGIAYGQRLARLDRDTGKGEAHDVAAFCRVVSVNLVGTFNVLSRCAAAMLELDPLMPDGERGVLVTTASVAAEDGQVGQVAYAASKGGVAAMTLPIARDLSPSGIRAVSILPGLFETPMFATLPDEARAALAASVPFPKRLGRPEEYAALVAHIAENAMLNGCQIRLDGTVRLPMR